MYKCELLVGGYAYAVTDHIKNWDEITASFKRNDYDGIVRTFTDKFEFVKGARHLLMNEYKNNYLKAAANIVISTRNNSWTWTERFRCALNFSTLSDDGFVLSMNAVDDSVAALIKAKKGTEYEYSVDVVKDSVPLMYDGLEMIGQCSWIYTGDSVEKDNINVYTNTFAKEGFTTIPLFINGNPELPIKGSVDVFDVDKFEFENFGLTTPSLFKLTKQIDLERMNLLKVRFSCNFMFQAIWNGKGTCKVMLMHDQVFTDGVLWSKDIKTGYNGVSFEIDSYLTGLLDRNLYFVVELRDGATCEIWQTETDASFQTLSVEYRDRRSAVMLDVVKPQVLLNRLLKSMNGGNDGLTGVIVPSGEKRLDNALILAAESARKMPKAKLRTSFTKFSNWMSSVFGYVYDINGKVVTFRPREDYFKAEVVKEIKNYNGYQMSVNSSLIYSQVNVGFEKQDYESVNGKDEFRFTNIYNTGITMTDGKLELISPYRADAYGIEFLAQKIGEDTTDNESDNGVFFVCAQSDGEKYILDRTETIAGVISPETMFNVMYSPTSMIAANEAFLGGFIYELDYASSEGNTAVRINGNVENRDISLNKGLFSVNEVEFETSDIDLPEDMTGIVQFEHQGEMVQGYYKSADFHYTKTQSAKITLIVKK
jgi:hypothetical protein